MMRLARLRASSFGVRARNYATQQRPLSGVKVLDLSRVLAGPYSAQVLGDMGANIIKVEHPVRGDDTRQWGPPFAEGGESAYFLSANRNKRSVGIDLKHPQGQALIRRLVADADVLIENFLPGNMAKFGLDFEALHKINPKLVYASITGYGQTGPWSSRPGYDVMVEAEFGLMHITGYPDGPPAKVGVAIIDLTAGLYTAVSVLGALRHAEHTGEGQHLDIALADCQLASLANIASNVLVSGKRDTGRHGTEHPSICPYQAFETKDGSIMVGGGNDKLYKLFCDAIGKPEWKTDPRFATNRDRVAHRQTLVPAITEITRTRTTKEWETLWEGKGFPYAPINDVKDALEHPQAVAREMVTEVAHPLSGSVKLVSPPVKWSSTPPTIDRAPPTLGEHSAEILAEAGLTADEISQLIQKGVVPASK